MKNFIVAFLVFLVWSAFGLWIYSWLQPETDSAKLDTDFIENTQLNDSLSNKIPTKRIDTITIQQDTIETKKDSLVENKNPVIEEKKNAIGLKASNEAGDIIFIFPEGISIKKNSSEITIPKSIIDYKYKINTYLLEHPDQELHINSLYSPKESITNPNIGIQRGNEISKLLAKTGIPNEKIVVKSIIKDILFNENDDFNNSIYFTFKPLDEERIELLKKSIPNVRLVYPKFSDSGILVNKDLKTLLSELIVYFNNNPDKKINIVGHTDNIGNSLDNYNIGLKYARQVRWYLISKGDFNGSLLKASSKGESEPIDNNNTSRGRIANRRIEIIFN